MIDDAEKQRMARLEARIAEVRTAAQPKAHGEEHYSQAQVAWRMVIELVAGNVTELAKVNEKCTRTVYPDGSFVIRGENSDAFYNFFGGPISLIRVDPTWQEVSMMQPRAPGFSLGFSYAVGPVPDCVSGDDGVDIKITVCTPNP